MTDTKKNDQSHLDHMETHDRHKWLMQHGIVCKCKECIEEEHKFLRRKQQLDALHNLLMKVGNEITLTDRDRVAARNFTHQWTKNENEG